MAVLTVYESEITTAEGLYDAMADVVEGEIQRGLPAVRATHDMVWGVLNRAFHRAATPDLHALLLTIAYQESGCLDRRQRGGGPARGLWQFEVPGVVEAWRHVTGDMEYLRLVWMLGYHVPRTGPPLERLAEDDRLAAVTARLALRALPDPIPAVDRPMVGWEQYCRVWRPGKPDIHRWPLSWRLGHLRP